jgi:nicotinamidase-related amidase
MLKIENCCLVVVDVQGKLAQLMCDKEELFKNIQIFVKAAKILSIPIILCQQNPKALGPTLPEIAELLTGNQPIDKFSFSCCGQGQFNKSLEALGRKQVILCGMETHVCIYQTASDLLEQGYSVDLIADAVSSRSLQNKKIAIRRMRDEGVNISSVEMALFELIRTAEHPVFKQIAALIK